MVCRTWAAEVDAEVKEILVEQGLDNTQQHSFEQRRRAAKRVYERLADSEKQHIVAMIKAQSALGNTIEVRAR
jgi:hypothetical protein